MSVFLEVNFVDKILRFVESTAAGMALETDGPVTSHTACRFLKRSVTESQMNAVFVRR